MPNTDDDIQNEDIIFLATAIDAIRDFSIPTPGDDEDIDDGDVQTLRTNIENIIVFTWDSANNIPLTLANFFAQTGIGNGIDKWTKNPDENTFGDLASGDFIFALHLQEIETALTVLTEFFFAGNMSNSGGQINGVGGNDDNPPFALSEITCATAKTESDLDLSENSWGLVGGPSANWSREITRKAVNHVEAGGDLYDIHSASTNASRMTFAMNGLPSWIPGFVSSLRVRVNLKRTELTIPPEPGNGSEVTDINFVKDDGTDAGGSRVVSSETGEWIEQAIDSALWPGPGGNFAVWMDTTTGTWPTCPPPFGIGEGESPTNPFTHINISTYDYTFGETSTAYLIWKQ